MITKNEFIKNLIKNPKLSRHIADVAWGQFLTLLGYKSKSLGCEIKKVDRFFPSSKRCHVCGWIKQDLTLKDRQWKCEECHTFHESRDRNAAINILLFANNRLSARSHAEETSAGSHRNTAGSAEIHAQRNT